MLEVGNVNSGFSGDAKIDTEISGMTGTGPKARRFDSKRQEVLRVAGRVFAERGFHNTSLNDIGAALGTTASALYYYARSKDDLLDSCREIALEAIEAALVEGQTNGADGYGRVRIFFKRYAELVCSDFGRCLVLINLRDIPPALRSNSCERQRSIRRDVQNLISAGIEDGSIRPCDDLLMTSLLFGAFNHLTKWWSPDGPHSLEDVAATYLDALASGIARPDRLAP